MKKKIPKKIARKTYSEKVIVFCITYVLCIFLYVWVIDVNEYQTFCLQTSKIIRDVYSNFQKIKKL